MKKLFTILALLMAFMVNGFAQDTWTVAGSSTDVLGTSWDPTNTSNDMTLVDGNYVLVKSVKLDDEVELQFKVCKNHAWGEEYPSSNYYLKIPAGTWDVVFMFNTTEHDVYAVYKAQLLGSWNWDSSKTNLTLTRSEGTAWTGELDLTDVLADQEFKLVLNDGENGGWLGIGGVTIVAPDGWVDEETNKGEGASYNFILKNETTGYMTYTVTATWAGQWTLKIEGKDERVITTPGTPIWTGDHSYYCTDVTVDASKFADVTVGDILHIVIEDANQESLYNSQVRILNGDGNQLDAGINVGLKEDGTVVDFVLTGDILTQLKAKGLKLGGYGYSSKLITVESTTTTGSDKSIWLGNQNTNVDAIGMIHFKNANDFTGIKVGDVIRVTVDPKACWMKLKYKKGDSWAWTDFADTEVEVINNYWDNYVDFLVKSESAAEQLNDDTNNHGVIINVGDDANYITQIEIIPFDGNYYLFYDKGDGTYVKGETMEESEGVYTGSVSGAKYFVIVPNTALNETGDGIGYWLSAIRPVATNNFLVEFFNYSDATVHNNGKVWEVADNNKANIIVSYSPKDNKFEITNALTITAPDDDYITYSNGAKINVGEAPAYIIEGVADGQATLKQIDANKVLPASTGILLKGAKEYVIYSAFMGDEDADALADVSSNLLIGSGDYTYDITGLNGSVEYKAYILADGANGVGFYPLASYTEDNQLAAHKAFLAVPVTTETPAPFYGFGGEGTTGINSVERGALSVEGCYTLDGRRVEQPTKGLYIMNGKKVLVK